MLASNFFMGSDRTQQGQVVIVGAGPAGLTAAYELSKNGVRSVVVEQDATVGGISRTVSHHGYRFDLGGHRFFSKVPLINQIWEEILGDEFLTRPRLSRIYFEGRFFHYPLQPINALAGLGLTGAIGVLGSFLLAKFNPNPVEENFEQWVTNRFGKRLFDTFFKSYTEKVWGVSTKELSADWAAQRIRDLSLGRAIRHALFGERRGQITKTLIDRFRYPRFGPGQMWERCRDLVGEKGSQIVMNAPVERVRWKGKRVNAIAISRGGASEEASCGELISSATVRDFIAMLDPAPPEEVLAAARALRHRDFLVVGLVIDQPHVFPDNWIYIHTPGVRVGRIQNFKNWSPDMVPDPKRTALGMEYFVWKGDEMWNASDDSLIALAAREGQTLKLFAAHQVIDGLVIRVPNAYPIYDGEYRNNLARVRSWLDQIENLQLVGRQGQHRYNNQDHSMLTAWYAARNVLGERHDIWDVNVDADYHEEVTEEKKARGRS
jgi:protoporphyrinogen oxidase